MANPFLGQILGGVFGHAMRRRGYPGGMGGGLGGGLGGVALGSILGGMLSRGRSPMGMPGRRGLGGHGALLALMLPLALRWVQQNGGIREVLKRVQQKGYQRQAQSWVATGDNQELDAHAIEDVVGDDQLQQMAQRLGVPREEVAQAFAEILPEMVNQLTPQGQLPPDADQVLDDGRAELERELEQQKGSSVS